MQTIGNSSNRQIQVVESLTKFEDLLVTNNLFVDYFNDFLLNPSLGEKVKFNFLSGDLELIEEAKNLNKETKSQNFAENVNPGSENNLKTALKKPLPKKENSKAASKAEIAKKKLETQLKSIMKSSSSKDDSKSIKSSVFSAKKKELAFSNSNFPTELLKQVDNHSFKDINLVEIQPFINPSDLKDPIATQESKIPVLNTTYNVNILKKPYSMKWLRNRRLTLFLQSDLYNEFKLAMLLSQCEILKNDLSKDDFKTSNIKLIKLEIDDELLEMCLNPFKAKNDLEKLKSFFELQSEMSEKSLEFLSDRSYDIKEIKKEENHQSDKKPENSNILSEQETVMKQEVSTFTESSQEFTENKQEKNIFEPLIPNNRRIFKSFNTEKSKTNLIFFKSYEIVQKNDTNNDKYATNESIENEEKKQKEIEFYEKLAKTIVEEVMKKSLIEVAKIIKNEKHENTKIENTNQINTFKETNQPIRESEMSDFSFNKTFSRLSYYKDFQTDLTIDQEKENEDKVLIQFEDEPYELSDNIEEIKFTFRKNEIEEFKTFLKENDAFLFFKMWIEIEKMNEMLDHNEKINYAKHLKATYNQPQTLNRLKKVTETETANSSDTRKKYHDLYTQYENNLDFWSLEHLTNTLKKSLLNILVTYWWPKFCIRLNAFSSYIENKYPLYSKQKNLLSSSKSFIDDDLYVKNIEKSLSISENNKPTLIKETIRLRELKRDYKPDYKKDTKKTMLKLNDTDKKKPLPKVKLIDSAKSNRNLSSKSMIYKTTSVDKIPGLEGYDLDEFKTSPPVGWKRPQSTASILVKQLFDIKQKEQYENRNSNEKQKRSKLDKEIYFEAIYKEELAGKIFMNYLLTRNKSYAINRLKCLSQLVKYKDLFYDENSFNQENVKKNAFEIFKKFIAVSASHPIDCPKNERLKLHYLFADPNYPNNIRPLNEISSFRPVYEDSFNEIEEFLLISLYDDWKTFMEEEDSHFKHNQIESIERSINIRSKQIDELVNQGLVKLSSHTSSSNLRAFSRRDSENSIGYSSTYISTKDSNLNYANSPKRSNILSLKEIINNSREFEMFKQFLQSKNAFNDIICWMDMESFGQIDPTENEQIDAHAIMLKSKYLNKKYFFSRNGPVDETTQNMILEKIGGWNVVLQDRVPNILITLVKKQIENKLVNYWLPMYQNSEFRAKLEFNTRTQMTDVVDDVLFLKNRNPKMKQIQKIKKYRWLYSSQMVLNFAKAIKNSFTAKLFNKFLSFKSASSEQTNIDSSYFDFETESNNLVNDLNFLIEVQEYKDMCQKSPEDERSILFKMNHIVDCYINNRILPKIRIDISEELAKEIIYKKDYASPYLFLEANLISFNVLMPYWIEFNKMRSTKDLEILDEFSAFKKLKDFKPNARSGSANSQDSLTNDQSIKWRYNQYVKALKTQLVI